eukprot:1990249-Amphidinium_carterae.1
MAAIFAQDGSLSSHWNPQVAKASLRCRRASPWISQRAMRVGDQRSPARITRLDASSHKAYHP